MAIFVESGDIRIDVREGSGFAKARRELDPRLVDLAALRALNRTVGSVRAAARKKIIRRWNIKSAELNPKMRALKAKGLADLTAIVRVRGRPISLAKFGATWKRGTLSRSKRDWNKTTKRAARAGSGGVTARIERGRVVKLPHAFMEQVRAGRSAVHQGVFERMVDGKSRHPSRPWSLPVQERASITLASMVAQAEVTRAMDERATEMFAKRFDHEIGRLRR